MSRPAEQLPHRASGDTLAALSRCALATFVEARLSQPETLTAPLRREAAALLGAGYCPDWTSMRQAVESGWPPTGDPLARLVADLRLSLPEATSLCLAGETETSHAVVMAVSALQAPDGPARPSVHLTVALIEALFGPGRLDALALQATAPVRHGLLAVTGDGPLPLRALQLEPALWSVLRERGAAWPGCGPLTGDAQLLPGALRRELPRVAAALASGEARGVVLRSRSTETAHAAAIALATAMERQPLAIPASGWEQTPALSTACRYGGWLPVISPELGPGETWRPWPDERITTPMVASLGTDGAVDDRGMLELTLTTPSFNERRDLWQQHGHPPEQAAELAGAALLDGHAISRVAGHAEASARLDGRRAARSDVAQGRRRLSADRLRLLAHPVAADITRDTLVVPELVADTLDEVVARARRRDTLHRSLGVTLTATGHPGLRALFTGPSGTGKTLAAGYVAGRLDAPLYRVDLAAVMNKYIGESEKSLGRLLDAAAGDDVVLLFDEADALFGRRSDGKQTGERYANNLTNFLLTRIEQHPGVVILTSNARERIDEAFTRRLDHVVEFPLPGFEERLRLWHSHLGERAPDDEALRHLASHCDLAGGHLRVAVLDAAASVADDQPVPLAALVRALAAQYRKLGRGLPASLERLAEEPG